MKILCIGIDPGTSGGIGAVASDGGVARAWPMPATTRDLCALIESLHVEGSTLAALERVWSSPGWGHVGAFRFGLNYGDIRGILTALRIPFDEVLPRDWQRVIGVVYPKGKPRDKNITKRRAQALFPNHTITHAIADALLIAEFCRRVHGGRNGTTHKADRSRQGETREEFERDRFGETGDRLREESRRIGRQAWGNPTARP